MVLYGSLVCVFCCLVQSCCSELGFGCVFMFEFEYVCWQCDESVQQIEDFVDGDVDQVKWQVEQLDEWIGYQGQ